MFPRAIAAGSDHRFGAAILAAAALATVFVAGACGGSARARSHTSPVTISAAGRVGPLRIDVSNRRAVVGFAGRPQAERRGRTDRGHPYDALEYGCGANAGSQALALVHGGPRCRTVFFIDGRSGRLGLFYTIQPRYVESHGVRVGMPTATAERLLRQRVIVGCTEAIRLSSRHALLTVAFAGGTVTRKPALRGGHVSLFALHGDRHDPGFFECT